LVRAQRDPAEPQPFHVAGDRPHRHAEIAGQAAQRHPLAVGGVQSFDQCLLALDTPQREVPVSRSRRELDTPIHRRIVTMTLACQGWFVPLGA
jgi:hypothetical protein